MDPQAALNEVRTALRDLRNAEHRNDSDRMIEAAIDLADAFANLDEWIAKGGFLPHSWTEARERCSSECAAGCNGDVDSYLHHATRRTVTHVLALDSASLDVLREELGLIP